MQEVRQAGDRATDGTPPSPTSHSRPLTDRELDVLRYLPTRLSTGEIARQLGISPNTVKTHLKNIYQKLGARSRNEAVVKASQLRMVDDLSTALVSQLANRSPALVRE